MEIKGSVSPLSEPQQRFLGRVQRFTLNIIAPDIANRVALVGYDNDEHAQMVRLMNLSLGQHRPMDHGVSEGVRQGLDAQDRNLLETLRQLDAFENVWFPRVRATLQRFIAKEQRATFEAAFFLDLAQQPLGPAVVDSVTKLLNRAEDLQHSEIPGAREAWASLVKKGLSDGERARVRGILEQLQSLRPASQGFVSPQEIEEAARLQLSSLEELEATYRDWATTLRDVLDHQQLLRLGLRVTRRPQDNPEPPDA